MAKGQSPLPGRSDPDGCKRMAVGIVDRDDETRVVKKGESNMTAIRQLADRIRSITGTGVVSRDPANLDAQHELSEMLPDLDDLEERIIACMAFLRGPGIYRIRVDGKLITREQLADLIDPDKTKPETYAFLTYARGEHHMADET